MIFDTRVRSLVVGICCLFLGPISSVFAQNPRPMAKPAELGLRIPLNRTAIEVNDRNVLVHPDLIQADFSDEAIQQARRSKGRTTQAIHGTKNGPSKTNESRKANLIVAKVYFEIGDRYVILLPDGSFRAVRKLDVTPTERPFEPLKRDDLAALLRQQFPGFKTRVTKRYICVYNTSDGFCESNSTILETMYPALRAYFRRQKFDVHDPETPLIVVMFRNKAEFQRYRDMPDSLLAYYNGVNNRVFLYQWSATAFDAPMIAVRQATSTIAHEGVHQILHNIGVQKRLSDWPIWVSEGLAEYFAPTTTGSRSKWKGVGKPNDLRMRELFKHFKRVRGLGSGNLVQHVITADQLNSTEYAVAWALTHYMLTKRKSEFFDYLRDVSQLGPLQEGSDQQDRFKEFFGESLASIEREMIKHIRGLPYTDPVLNQPYFLVTAISGGKKYGLVTSSRNHAKSRLELLKKMNPVERTQARFAAQPYPNLALARQALAAFTRSK